MKFSTAVVLSLIVASVEGLSTSHFQTMAGARGSAVRPASYAPGGGKPKVVVNNMGSSYLNNVNRSPVPSSTSTDSRFSAPAVSSFPTTNTASHLTSFGGSSTVATTPRGKFSAFSGKKPKAVVNSMGSSYLNNVGGVPNPIAASPSASSSGPYLSHLSGSSSAVVSSPRGKFSAFSGKKPKAVVNNMGSSYLNKVSGESSATPSSVLISSGPASGSYLSDLNGASATVAYAPKGKFSAFSGKKPKVVVYNMGSSYLNKLKESPSTSSSTEQTVTSVSYLGNLGGASVASIPRGRFSAFSGKKPKVIVNNMGSSYLNGIRSGSSAPDSASYSPPASTSQTVSAPRGSYSPFSGGKPKAVVNSMGSSYLNNVGNSVSSVSSYSAPVSAAPVSQFRVSSPVRGSFSPAGKKPKTVVNNMGSSYLNTVNSGSGLSSFESYSRPAPAADSFSNWELAPKPVKSWTPYKSNFAPAPAPGPSAPASTPKPVAVVAAGGSYLESLGNGGRRW